MASNQTNEHSRIVKKRKCAKFNKIFYGAAAIAFVYHMKYIMKQGNREELEATSMGDKVAKGKGKVKTATTMRKTLQRLVEATESHNEAEREEIEATSHLHGQYSIPDCIEVLKSIKEEGLLNDRQFNYALELLKDSQNRVILMSLKDSMDALVNWILYKYDSKDSSI